MKGSGLEVYVAAAYWGLTGMSTIYLKYHNVTNILSYVTGIFNGKSWVKAMRSFRGVSAALLKRFLCTGPKTFEQIEQYLDLARLHPTGLYWVALSSPNTPYPPV